MAQRISKRTTVLIGVGAVLAVVAAAVYFWPGEDAPPSAAQTRADEINQTMNSAAPPPASAPAPAERPPRGAVRVK